MSDQNKTIASLEEQIKLLTNALQRERNANNKLQEKIEVKSQETYEENKSFIDALEKASSRHVQLQFLSNLTNDMFIARKIDDMVEQFIGNVSSMLEGCGALDISIDNTQEQHIKINQFDTQYQRLEPITWDPQYTDAVNQLLFISDESESWKRVELGNVIKLPSLSHLLKYNTILISVIKFSAKKSRILLLDIDHYCYSEEFKQTLNTASQQFSLIVKRRLTEVELSYNYQKLKSTVQELKSTQNQLLHSEKMASLGQLAAGVAHEINNPLSFIASNLETLTDYCQLFEAAISLTEPKNQTSKIDTKELAYARDDVNDLIASCIRGVERISDIINSLKTFSRKDQDQMKAININEAIESALKMVWNKLKYNYSVSQKLKDNLPNCLANSGELQQVFMNLFVNAAQAMKDKGELSITSDYINNYIEVKVSDTGCGMDETSIKRLFEPFYTTKNENEGTGLGLSVSYAILEKHNALISVNSEKNKGSTFTLRFPVYQ